MDSDLDTCRANAARRVSEWLTVPQDLEKLEQLRTNVLNKKNATDAQLKAAVQTQLESAQEGLELLNRSFASVLSIRAEYAPCCCY